MTEFPRDELPAAQHDQIRDVLVRAAVRPATKPARPRILVPVVAATAAVVLVVVAVALFVRRPEPPPTPADETVTHVQGACWADRQKPTPAEASAVLHLAPPPPGWTMTTQFSAQVLCDEGEHPQVTYVRRAGTGPEGTIDAAVHLSALDGSARDRALDAIGNMGMGPADPDTASIELPPSTPVTIRGRAGRLTGEQIEWQEPDGQWWRISAGGLPVPRVVEIAEQLRMDGAGVDWPGADREGFDTVPVPEHWAGEVVQNTMVADYLGAEAQVQVRISRDQPMWQERLPEFEMPVRLVTVNGHPGVLAEHGDARSQSVTLPDGSRPSPQPELILNVAGDLQANFFGKNADQLLDLARNLRPVTPDDPVLR